MKEELLLEKLEEAAARLSIQLDYDDLHKGEVNTRGGIFMLKGERRIILHRGLSVKDKVDTLAGMLARLDTEGIHLPDAVRERIKKVKGH